MTELRDNLYPPRRSRILLGLASPCSETPAMGIFYPIFNIKVLSKKLRKPLDFAKLV